MKSISVYSVSVMLSSVVRRVVLPLYISTPHKLVSGGLIGKNPIDIGGLTAEPISHLVSFGIVFFLNSGDSPGLRGVFQYLFYFLINSLALAWMSSTTWNILSIICVFALYIGWFILRSQLSNLIFGNRY